MIPHQNLFSGALGKLHNIGGSRIYTTPHTVSVPAEYSINVTYNIQGDLVGHSLDGRLWLYRSSRILGIIALKWNAGQGKLEYAAALNLSNNDDVVLACGLDWVLTNNNIFMSADEEPYIRSSRLFDANIPDTFLYSILRSGSIGTSGIDPFTGEAWGKREDNGNAEGTGYFSKSNHLLYPAGTHTFEKCYSLLPAVGDWQIFENFLVRRPDAECISSYNYMQAIRPLIPLEFCNGAAAYGTGYNFDHRGIQLSHCNGEIRGKGLYNIGRISLIPAVFGEGGTVQEYYLYISPDYPCSSFLSNALDTSDAWLNIALAPIGSDALYGVLSKQADTLASSTCFKSTDGRVFIPQTGDFQTISENNGRIFVDALTYKGLLLDDNGAQFLLGEVISDTQNIVCKTLSQWLTPAGHLDAITDGYIVASADNAAFCTSLVTGFNRQFLSPNTIPLTARAFQKSNEDYYRLAISEGEKQNGRKLFGVNQILSQDVTPKAIQWQDFYKEAVKIRFLNFIEVPRNEDPIIYAENYTDTPVFILGGLTLYSRKIAFTYKYTYIYGINHKIMDSAYFEEAEIDTGYTWINQREVDKIYDHVEADIYFIDPDNGQKSETKQISFSVPNNVILKPTKAYVSVWGWPTYVYDYQDVSEESTLYHKFKLVIHEHKVCISAWDYFKDEQVFLPIMELPDNVKPFTYSGVSPTIILDNFALNDRKPNLLYEDYLPNNLPSYVMHCLFYEQFSKAIFAYNISSSAKWLTISEQLASAYITFGTRLMAARCHHGVNTTTKNSGTFSLVSLYIVILFQDETMYFLVFRTETDPDVFDFYSETERSKLH